MSINEQKVLFFIAGSVPTEDEQALIDTIPGKVRIRVASQAASYGDTPEAADYVCALDAATIPASHTAFDLYDKVIVENNDLVSDLIGGEQARVDTTTGVANGELTFIAKSYGAGGNDISVEYVQPETDLSPLSASVAVGSKAIMVSLETGPKLISTLSTNLTGTNNDLTFTAATPGGAGNNIRVAYVNPGTPSAALSVAIEDETDIVVNLATSAGTAQVETATAAGTVSGDGNAEVVVTAAGVTGSPVTLAVAVVNGDTPTVWAGKVRVALAANAPIAAVYTVGGSGTAITLTKTIAAANDATLNIALATGTATGVTTAATSADTTAGVAPAITSTAALVAAAVTASAEAAALVTVANKAANDGTGVVTALAATNLDGGSDAGVALSTAEEVMDAMNAAISVRALVSVSLATGNDGSGVLAGMAALNLADGADGDAGVLFVKNGRLESAILD